MLLKIFLLALIVVSLFVETTVLPFPFVLLFSLLYLYYSHNLWGLIIVFFSSIFLDVLLLHTVGSTSIFIFSTMLGVILLEKVFSFQGALPFTVMVIIGLFIYSNIIGYPFSIMLSLLVIILLFIFALNEKRKKTKGGILA